MYMLIRRVFQIQQLPGSFSPNFRVTLNSSIFGGSLRLESANDTWALTARRGEMLPSTGFPGPGCRASKTARKAN